MKPNLIPKTLSQALAQDVVIKRRICIHYILFFEPQLISPKNCTLYHTAVRWFSFKAFKFRKVCSQDHKFINIFA